MQTLLQNLRYSLRVLLKNPGLTITILLTLALGIGANTAIFTVDYATLLAPLPMAHPEQLVMVWSKVGGHRNGISAGDFLDWQRLNHSFQSISAVTNGNFNLATKGAPEQVNGRRVTPGFFNMMGYPLMMGRDFLPEEGTPGNDHVVMLTHKLWLRLGANPNIVGQQMRINSEPYTVVGVLAEGVSDRYDAELTTPLAFRPEQINHDYHWMIAMARLKPGVTIHQAFTKAASTSTKTSAAMSMRVENFPIDDRIGSRRISCTGVMANRPMLSWGQAFTQSMQSVQSMLPAFCGM